MTAKVLDLRPKLEALEKYPDWFRAVWRKPVVYHRDCLIDFKLVKDETRFAGGIT